MEKRDIKLFRRGLSAAENGDSDFGTIRNYNISNHVAIIEIWKNAELWTLKKTNNYKKNDHFYKWYKYSYAYLNILKYKLCHLLSKN